MKQHTLKQSFSLAGKGLHTGLETHATFLPADINTGIRICRIDIDGHPTYEAVADYVSATERGTVLEKGEWKVSTVEHALSALYAMNIDNCLIEVDGPEIPILDGSARMYVEAIEQVGTIEQNAEQKVYVITEPIEYKSENGTSMLITPCDHYEVEVVVKYPSDILKEQRSRLDNLTDYGQEIAGARTFCFVREVEPLLRMGLIKGGDLKNALVIYDTLMSQDAMDFMTDKLGQEHVDASKLGYLSELKYENEPARHKLLDVIGDMSLLGGHIQGRISAVKPGHTFNTQCCKQLKNILCNNH